MIKMTCAVKWIIVRERRAESTSLSHPDLAGSRVKTVSRHLELSLDAVDDHDFFGALSCSSCSTTCCCITIWAVESEKWFLLPQLPKQTLHSWNRQIQICRFLFGVAFSYMDCRPGLQIYGGPAPHHGLTINQVSAWSDVNCRRSKPEMKNLQKFSKGHNSANIWWSVTSKQYALLHIMVLLEIKF